MILQNLPLVIQQALKSPLEQKHGAIFISRRGEILGAGFNCFTSRLDFVFEYTPRLSTHAESSAIRYIPKSQLIQGTIVVIRLRSSGKLGLSKPCKKCIGLLSRRKIYRVLYSNNKGNFECLYL